MVFSSFFFHMGIWKQKLLKRTKETKGNCIETSKSIVHKRTTKHQKVVWTSQKQSCRDPSPRWHVAHIFLMTRGTRFYPDYPPSGFSQEYTWCASPIRTPSGRGTRHSQTSHLDDRHITSGRPTYPIRICCSDHWLKWANLATSFWQLATTHILSPAKRKDKSDDKSPPMISDSHDLWQLSVGWWWPCHHLEASWRAKKSSHH